MNVSKLIQSIFHLSLSRTARNTYIVSVGNAVSMILGFLFIVTLVRSLTLSDFGYFSALYALLLLISDVADMGMGTSLSRFLPPLSGKIKRSHSFLKTAFYAQIVIAFLVSMSIALLAYVIGIILFKSQSFYFLIQVTAFGIFCAILSNFILYTLSARQKFIHAALYNSMGGAIRLIILIPYLILGKVSLSSSILIQSVSLFFLLVLGILFIRLDFLFVSRTKGDLGKLLQFASFLGIARSITAVAGKLDVLMLVSLSSATQAGIFATASRVTSIYPLFAGSFSTVIAPKLAKITRKNELHTLMTKVIFGTAGLIGTIFMLILIAQPFMQILFGDKGTASVPVFQLLLVSMIFFVASIPAVSLTIYYLHKPQILTINSIIQVLIVFFGNIYFIPIYGRFGPAISLILAYGITLVLTSYLSFHYLKKKYE